MAVIEFKNPETERTIMALIAPTSEMLKLRRMAYLTKNGLIHPDITLIKNIDARAYY